MRKSYDEKRRKRKEKGHQRPWKLKSMKAETVEEPIVKGKSRHGNAAGVNRDELDRERFLQVLSHFPKALARTLFCKIASMTCMQEGYEKQSACVAVDVLQVGKAFCLSAVDKIDVHFINGDTSVP